MMSFTIFSSIVNADNLPQTAADSAHLQTILTIIFTIMGAVALLLMVIAGLRYVTAAGDPQKMATARRMIVYTAVGLVVAALATAIVNFFLESSP